MTEGEGEGEEGREGEGERGRGKEGEREGREGEREGKEGEMEGERGKREEREREGGREREGEREMREGGREGEGEKEFSPLIIRSMTGCEVLCSSTTLLGLANPFITVEPASSPLSSCCATDVLRSFTMEKSTLAARPAMAEGARFFLAAYVEEKQH